MKFIDFKNIVIEGELAVRSGLNMTRLEGKWYRPDEVFTADTHNWPGDWEGRIILAMALLGQATKRQPAWLDDIIELIPEHLNEKGYLGPIHPEGVSDEQQLAGHSWLMRGLVETYKWKKDERCLPIIESVAKNLFLQSKGNYKKYPTDPQTRFNDPNWVLSKLQTKTTAHAETSDCGCAFIPVDGVTAAYEFLKWPQLKELAEEMIERFYTIDFVGLKVQTHATLSAIRGIIRMYDLEGDRKYLDMAKEVFDHYKKEAWTEAYGNYNWFDHPRWTEPCGIIDSFMVATQLWKHTNDPSYLVDAHYIYYNALSHGQRDNGSFGTDSCVGAKKADAAQYLTPINFETYWCCSMRGGEGFSRAVEYNYLIEGNDVYIPFFNKGKAILELEDGTLKIVQKTKYPYDGKIELTITESSLASEATIKLFVPAFSSGTPSVKFNGVSVDATVENGFVAIARLFAKGDKIVVELNLKPYTRDLDNKRNSIENAFKFMFGPMVLGLKIEAVKDGSEDISDDDSDRKMIDFDYLIPKPRKIAHNSELINIGLGKFQVKGADLVLESLCNVKNLTSPDLIEQIIFLKDE